MKGPPLRSLPFLPRPSVQPDAVAGPAAVVVPRPMFGGLNLKLRTVSVPVPSGITDAQAITFVIPARPMQFGSYLGGKGIISRKSIGPIAPISLFISGVTKDSAGAILGSCVVKLYRTLTDQELEATVSDSVTGAYSFNSVGPGLTYYVVAYKPGAPDVMGTTLNTLVGI